MKLIKHKVVLGLVLVAMTLPNISHGQVSSLTTQQQQQLIALLVQQIQLLQKQVAALMEKESEREEVKVQERLKKEEERKRVDRLTEEREELLEEREVYIKRLNALAKLKKCPESSGISSTHGTCDNALKGLHRLNEALREIDMQLGTDSGIGTGCLYGIARGKLGCAGRGG